MSESGQELLALMASELKTLPNYLLIEGHTDATQYSSDASYTNWELSADRANAARRLLQQDGVRADQVTQVRGYADQLLRVKNNPYDPSNRRISILVKNRDGPLPNLQGGKMADAAPAVAANQEDPKSARGGANSPGSPQAAADAAKTSSAGATAQTKPTAAQLSLMERVKGLIPGGKK